MIEYINDYFGITNTVSVPVFITLFVFFTGVVITHLFKLYAAFVSKRNTRRTFRKLIERTIKEIKLKEKYLKQLIDTLYIEYGGNWGITHVNLSYIDTFFDFNYIDIFIAFNSKYSFCSRKKSLRENAFHRSWSLIRGLRFMEEPSYKNLETMIDKFNSYKNSYSDGLDSYRIKFEEEVILNDGQKMNKTYAEFYTKLDGIFSDWQQNNSTNHTYPSVTYKDIVKPSLEVCKQYAKLPGYMCFSNPLMQSTNDYIAMKHLVDTFRNQYQIHYYFYRTSRRLLKKILIILKK
ncbi:hypothetical protein [Labilibaculum euxinus]